MPAVYDNELPLVVVKCVDDSHPKAGVPVQSPLPVTPSTAVSTPQKVSHLEPASPTPSRASTCSAFAHEREIPFECFERWQENMKMSGNNSHRSAVMAFNFCAALEICDWQACCIVLACVRMLVSCQYDMDDIETTFAQALYNLRTKCGTLMAKMGAQEKVLVAVLHVYCAHSLVFDEFVPLRVWHEWLFHPFCNQTTMAQALKKVCVLAGYKFCVKPADVLFVQQELRNEPW